MNQLKPRRQQHPSVRCKRHKIKKKERLTLILQTDQSNLTDFNISESSVQLDSSVTKNKKPTHNPTPKFKFLRHRFFGIAVFAILLQKQKSCINYFIFYFGMQHICFCPNAQYPFFIVVECS